MRGWFLFLAGAVVAFTLLPIEIAILLLAIAAVVAALLPSRRREAAAERTAAELRERMGYFPGQPDLPSGGTGAAVGCSEAALEGIRKAETVSTLAPVSGVASVSPATDEPPGAAPADEGDPAREPWHRIRDADVGCGVYLSAAELARLLVNVEGDCCPICGSERVPLVSANPRVSAGIPYCPDCGHSYKRWSCWR